MCTVRINKTLKVSYSTVQYFPEIPSPTTIDEHSENTVSSATIDELSEYTVSSATIDDPPDYTCNHQLQLTNLPIVIITRIKNTTKIVVVALARIEIITLPMIGMADMIVPDT